MKTTFSYDHYYLYDEMEKNLLYFTKKYKNLCTLESICETDESRQVYAMTLTNLKTGKPSEKPAFHIDGNTHAGEVTGSMATMHAIDYLLTNYGKVKDVTKLLDTMTIYVIPRISPDGAETYLTTPYTIRSLNKVHNPKEGGIKEEDLDGDHVIRMMRIPSLYGAWKKDPKDPERMVLRDPDDTDGEFYDIYPEGIFEPYDGDENLKMKKNDWSLDFNRNFPYGWFPENRQHGAGDYPLSNKETKALADWIIAHPNIFGVSTNHTSGGLLLYPPGTMPESKMPWDDKNVFKTIAKMGQAILGYEPLNIYDSFISDPENYDSGAFDDWCYQARGLVAFTVEIWDLYKRVGVPIDWKVKEEEPEVMIKRFNACMDWVKKNAPKEYRKWKTIQHPTFGKVEIGGFNYKFTHQNPPTKFLKEIMEQMTSFMIRFAKSRPMIVIDEVKKKHFDNDLYEISVVVGNTGYLPTYVTECAKNLQIEKPVRVSITGASLEQGKEVTEIGDLSGYSRSDVGTMYGNYSNYANAIARKKVTWLLRGKKGSTVTITASHEKAGTVTQKVKL